MAHAIMTRGLVKESGMFRSQPVGVVDREGDVLRFGTLPPYVLYGRIEYNEVCKSVWEIDKPLGLL